MRLRIGAVDRERFFEMRYCLVEAPLFQQNRSQIVLGVRIVGADCQHLVVMYPRLVKPFDCLQGTRQIVVRLDKSGLTLSASRRRGRHLRVPQLPGLMSGYSVGQQRINVVYLCHPSSNAHLPTGLPRSGSAAILVITRGELRYRNTRLDIKDSYRCVKNTSVCIIVGRER